MNKTGIIIRNEHGRVIETRIINTDRLEATLHSLNGEALQFGYIVETVEVAEATVFKRYDVNGAFTGDVSIELGIHTQRKNSMYRVEKHVYIMIDGNEI
jgi:hypothetical protein